MNKSTIIRGVSKNARFFITDTTKLVKEAQLLHELDPIGATFFGQLITIAGIMGKDLKSEKDVLTIRFNGDGPYGILLATANQHGHVKGYVGNVDNLEDILAKHNNNENISLLGEGTLQVIKDMGLKDPFVGLTKIHNSDVADSIAHYYYTSEQIKSVVSLGVKIDENGLVEKAGGFVIQLLPGASDDFIDKIENKINSIRSITDLLKGGFDPQRIAKLLYEDISTEEDKLIEDHEILNESTIEYKCDCNRDKFFSGLKTLTKEEITEILEENNGILEVECHFCMKKYKYSTNDFVDK